MADSFSISNSQLSRKRRKIDPKSPAPDMGRPRWRNDVDQQIYSLKLVDALRHPDSAVRHAADRVLAASAKGRTRWSRAILTGNLSLRLACINRNHRRAAAKRQRKKATPLQGKLKVLSRLVPGCRKVSLPEILEETSDYIAALEMQVRAMTFLTGLLSGAPATAP